MNKFFLTTATFLSMFCSIESKACVPARVSIDESSEMSAAGLRISGQWFSTQDLNQNAIKGHKTYNLEYATVTYLGSIGDDKGITQSSFLVFNLKTNIEKVYVISSNYKGNGVTFKGMFVSPKSTLLKESGGCGGGGSID